MRNRNAEQAGWHLLVATAEDLRFDCSNLVAQVPDALAARLALVTLSGRLRKNVQ